MRVYKTNGKSISSAISAQLTAECPILYNGRPFPAKLPLHMGSGPHLIDDPLSHSEPTIHGSVLPSNNGYPSIVDDVMFSYGLGLLLSRNTDKNLQIIYMIAYNIKQGKVGQLYPLNPDGGLLGVTVQQMKVLD